MRKVEFYLENGIEQHRLNPRHFQIPSSDDIDKLQIGSLVKLIFLLKKPLKNGCQAERMWVKITEINEETFVGTLDNQPYYLKSIKADDAIRFRMENIVCISGGEASFDETQFAIITQRALERREINWVVRTNHRHNEQDSGWQLFYGDEDDVYMNNTKNATLIRLDKVLTFEPLLEKVFAGSGSAFEFDAAKNAFVPGEDQ